MAALPSEARSPFRLSLLPYAGRSRSDPNSDTRAIQKVDDHHYNLNNKKGGKTTVDGTIVVEGKTRTLTLHRTDASGKKSTSTAVYDKQ